MEDKSKICVSKTKVDLGFASYEEFERGEADNPLFFTKVNGAIVNQAKVKAFIGIGNRDANNWYNECYCTLEQDDKLGDFFDVLPYGVINKTITGIGATTLELNSDRNSIIVLPTKSIAYGKYKIKQSKDGNDSCMYVGSPIGEITSDITISRIKEYIARDNGNKKFLVVADSLFKVLDAIGEDNYDNYFLMVDEIDTLQIDNTYRSVLERVIDYYGKFKQTNRAAVSATLRGFTHPELLKETIITTRYPKFAKRNIELIHTNNEDACLVSRIKEILEIDAEAKILVAYNSIENINVCIKLLQKELGEEISEKIGILCSEISKDKTGNLYIEIEEEGLLPKNIVFMTCAYFVGVDINTKCHVISVSSFNKPFTLLSKEKLAQIVGRCRLGALSETIIYTTRQIDTIESYDEYKDYLLKKALILVKAIEAFKRTLAVAPELFTVSNYVEEIVKNVGLEKMSCYSIPIIRENVDKEIVPSYFNIDALLEKWDLLHELYKDEHALYNELNNDGHKINMQTLDFPYTESQMELSNLVQSEKSERIEKALQKAKEDLMELNNLDASTREIMLKRLHKNCTLELKQFYDYYIKLSPYYESEYLINLLAEHNNEDARLYRGFINSLVFHTLDDTHPFKSLVLGVFEYHKKDTDKTVCIINTRKKKEKMKTVFDTYFKGYNIRESIQTGLMPCLFKKSPTKKYFKIVGLNPMEFEEPVEKIKEMDVQTLYNLFILT